jgi:hypothetical protein
MKNISIILAFLIASLLSNAQETSPATNPQIGTIFGKNKDASLGWFVGFDNSYTQFDARDVHMGGFNAGLILNHNFSVGFSGTAWTNRNTMYYNHVIDSTGAYLEGGFGRLLLEYTLNPASAIHFTFPLMIGAGGASYVTDMEDWEWEDEEWDLFHKTLDTDVFFSVEPGVRAEINVFKFMRFSAGVSYRWVTGLEMINTRSDMMNNFSATAALKFGKF